MSAISSIEWTDRTWNPVRGCSIVSPGCVNCYAMKQAHRFSGEGKTYYGLTKQTAVGPQWTGKIRTVEAALIDPLKWRTPSRVFVNSMSDLFHEDVPDTFIDQVFAVMAIAKRHTFQILTKRADRMRAYCSRLPNRGCNQFVSIKDFGSTCVLWGHMDLQPWPLPNVWLGVSVEDQKHANERIPLLHQTPAAVRFISAEPLLGPVSLRWMAAWPQSPHGAARKPEGATDHLDGLRCLDWVIVGGESGPGARPFDLAWARSIVEECKAAGIACFVKQLGKLPSIAGERIDGWMELQNKDGSFYGSAPCSGGSGKHGDPSEWPEDLRVRQFPQVHA